MTTRLFVWLLAMSTVLCACRKKDSVAPTGPPPPPEFGSSENNLGYLNQGIRDFQQAKSRLPHDLGELVTEKVITRIPPPPPGFAHALDRKSGLVTLQPAGPRK